MIVSLRLNEEDIKLFKRYAEFKKITLSELFRSAVKEKIENEYDLKTYNEAMIEFQKNPITHSIATVENKLQ